jgi:hypothetical protein
MLGLGGTEKVFHLDSEWDGKPVQGSEQSQGVSWLFFFKWFY